MNGALLTRTEDPETLCELLGGHDMRRVGSVLECRACGKCGRPRRRKPA